MKLIIISPFPPFRGGISKETEVLYNALIDNNHKVKIVNFKSLYPSIVFPGKNQYLEEYSINKKSNVVRVIDTINPFSWKKASKIILQENCNNIIFRYWHPILIPSYNYIIKYIKSKNSQIKIFCMCDNLFPHENFILSRLLIKRFLDKIDKFITMSNVVKEQIRKVKPQAEIKNVYLPLKDNFGKLIPKNLAMEKIGLNTKFVVLFFGLVRKYKGLDILIKAIKPLVENKRDFKLLIAGECYEKKKKYLDLIKKLNVSKYIVWVDKYIPDNELSTYFSACDVVVLPYKKVTQSGIVPIAYNYEKIVISSDINGFSDFVLNGKTGYLFNTNDYLSLSEKLEKVYLLDNYENFRKFISDFKVNFSLKNLVEEITLFIEND